MEVSKVKQVAVLGVGTMGPGIAQAFAQAGFSVRLQGRSEESRSKGLNALRSGLQAYLENGLIDEGKMKSALARVETVETLEQACDGADFVVEAVPENLDLKKEIYAQLDRLCPKNTILASNTSGLSITAMGSATNRPDKVVGAHFWNPPNLIPLVEVVRGEQTSRETLSLTSELMSRIGKKPVLVNKEVPGFIGTRLHQALIREAFYLVEQGIATFEDVDTVVKTSFGRRLPITGPFETCDLGGLDIFLAAAGSWQYLSNEGAPSKILAEKVENGQLGAKTGKGLYDWDQESVQRIVKKREKELIHYLKDDMGLLEQ